MKKSIIWILVLGVVIFAAKGDTEVGSYLLLDDFSRELSAIDTEWKGFTDRVMGGVSDMTVAMMPGVDGNFLRMQGKVSLENNGGFIQVRLMLESSLKAFDGSEYKGIRVKVRGEGSGYYIFLRTNAMILPWKYFAAPVPVTTEWRQVDIPWTAFKPGDYGRAGRLRIDKLKSLALVAYGKEFDAMIDMTEIGLYK